MAIVELMSVLGAGLNESSCTIEVEENEHGHSCRDGRDGADGMICDRQR